MGKAKKRSKLGGSFSDQVRNKSEKKRKIGTAHSVRTNPFEIKINKRKHKILGKNLTKFDKGVPGVSRSKAIQKRKDTLLVEFKNQKKTNRFVDQRIGENDPTANFEDKMLQRFATENKRHHEKASLFNIDDDEDFELTHKGESLRQVEKFESIQDSDEESDNDAGTLRGAHVTEGHFGGGILQKSTATDAEQEKSWKDRMEEMIAKSKQAKHERQSEKDEVIQMTDNLDDEWRQLHNVVATFKRKSLQDEGEERKEADNFDVAVNSLRFESRGTPSDRLKTEAELARLEKERLDKLEKERLKRMRGEQQKGRAHQSADDLDDGMDYGADDDDEFEVMYKDGQLVTKEQQEEEESDDGEQSLEESEESEESEDESDEQEVGEEGESSEDEDEYSDLDSAEELSDADEVEVNGPKSKKPRKEIKTSDTSSDSHIPYTFKVPVSYTELTDLLDKYTLEEQNTVIDRMRKCNHASLAAENKEHLVKLYGHLLEYFTDLSLRVPLPITLLDQLTVHLYQLAKQFPQKTAQHSKHVIVERQKLFTLYCQNKNGRGVWPFMDLLMCLKLLAKIYPTSDFRHEVITPAMIYASQIYSSCPVTNHRDVAVGLMLTTIMCEYVNLSKSLMPECINFLSALLCTTVKSDSTKVTIGTATVRTNLLVCRECGQNLSSQQVKPFSLSQVIVRGVGNSIYNTDQFVLSAINTSLRLLKRFVQLYRELCSLDAVFAHARGALASMQVNDFPDSLQRLIEEVKGELEAVKVQRLEYVCRERRKPKVLRLYEPSIEENFEAGKKKVTDKVAAEKQKLKHQYKKEVKATMRELRKDRAFLAEQTIKERVRRDAERQKKTNQILADLQGQQHEVNMHVKMNRKTKRR